MCKYPSGLSAGSSQKCSLSGLLSKELLIFDNKYFPTCAFISFVWCKQINPRSLHHYSLLPLRFHKKYCSKSFRRESSSIWQESLVHVCHQHKDAISTGNISHVANNGVLLWNEMHEYKSFCWERGFYLDAVLVWKICTLSTHYYSHRSPIQLGPCQWLSLPVDIK